MDQTLHDIATAALSVLKPLAIQNGNKEIEAHFVPTDKYSDSFMRGTRKGSGLFGLGGSTPTNPISWLTVSITLRPGVLSSQWVGYNVDIKNPESTPTLEMFREWPETPGEGESSEHDASPELLVQLLPHIIALSQTRLTADNQPAPREAPATMF